MQEPDRKPDFVPDPPHPAPGGPPVTTQDDPAPPAPPAPGGPGTGSGGK